MGLSPSEWRLLFNPLLFSAVLDLTLSELASPSLGLLWFTPHKNEYQVSVGLGEGTLLYGGGQGPHFSFRSWCLTLAFIVSNFHNFGGGVYGAHQLGPIPWPHPGGR